MSDVLNIILSLIAIIGVLSFAVLVLDFKVRRLRGRVARLERIVGTDKPGDGLWWHIGHLRRAVFSRAAGDGDPSRIDVLEERVEQMDQST
jgi:hypothetical protein